MEEKYIIQSIVYSLISKWILSKIKTMRYTFAQFKEEYPDDEACLKAVLQNRYGSTCPRCGTIGVKWHPITGRKGFVCSECDRHVYPLAGTIFRKSETGLWSWFYAIYLFSVSKNGVSAKELERQLGVTYKTAWRMAQQIRKLMEDDNEPLSGSVEMDETYFGAKRPRRFGHENKSVVFGMVERNGRSVIKHVKSSGSRSLVPHISASVDRSADVFTDQYAVYKAIPKMGFSSHTTVNHSKLEYVRGNVHTNTIEGFWSQLKRSVDGTYHAVSPKYLQNYLNEFAFRYNFRTISICPLLLERAAMPYVSGA